ncbi:hypothetical protein ACRE_030260 [Hapsidospora chrysogenum ATCC 11550]|uniref:Rhodopsin domain-containing protein n=1 Tax=Hapsidospora chrysogenum (strain ATCC 11550 / CBS 779.69 / DSM 880 / IAM 14645 / JCM 23072 / IMI 49137) TaxID=857340 RepID=A0A086TA25_HAPC1|nr:hypothetical protein ACRE_030260 [Hapsidospora chrysogenum ATCC 11550]
MGMDGKATGAMASMWFLFGLVSVFLLLRLYTRVVCIAAFGIDDYVYILAIIFLLIFTIFMQISAELGFGETLEQIDNMDRATVARLHESIGLLFVILGMPIAKASIGFFLLRLVNVRWHKIAIWAAMGLVSAASIVSTVVFDLFFSLFPWLLLWNLHMSRRDKITIGSSMSIGLIAAGAGIVRSTAVACLYTDEYLYDSVALVVWSSAELAATLICIGIPACLPLYRRIYRRFRRDHRHSADGRKGRESDETCLRPMGRVGKSSDSGQDPSNRGESSSQGTRTAPTFTQLGARIGGSTTETYIGRSYSEANLTSDEEALADGNSLNCYPSSRTTFTVLKVACTLPQPRGHVLFRAEDRGKD